MAIRLSDLPPSYSTLNLSPEEVPIAANERRTLPLIGTSFEEKNARIMFTQKVLSILLLQSVAVGIVLEIFAYYRITMKHHFIGAIVVLYLIAIFLMVSMDQVKNRKVYNYIMLVYYPITVTSVIVIVPTTVFDDDLQAKLRQKIVCAWMSYILASIVILFYCIFSLGYKHEFQLLDKFIITVSAFMASYFGLYMPLYMSHPDFDPITTLWITLSLYTYYWYVLYDIKVMTSGDYRSPLTPADHVTGAVNVQIDFLFIIGDFLIKKCSCWN